MRSHALRLKGLKRYVAFKIKVDFATGERAGGINPHDRNLVCLGWQNFEKGEEIRLIVNDKVIDEYVKRYGGKEGVEVIEGIENIDKAIDELIPSERQVDYVIYMPELFTASIIAKHLDTNDTFNVNDVPNPGDEDEHVGETRRRVLKHLMERGVKGIRPVKRVKKLSELIT